MLQALLIAFRTYSRIPVPEPSWNEKNMRSALCYFPLVGAAIAAAEFLWLLLSNILHCGSIFYAAVASLIPLAVTGGIHMDGFCDAEDALSSHQSRERMLEIMKDSHTGAFAVIMSCAWMLLYFAAFTSVRGYMDLWLVGFGFILSRALSGLAVINLKNARGEGMLHIFTEPADKQRVQNAMLAWIVISLAGLLIFGGIRGIFAAIVNGLVFVYYWRMTDRKFGGITGDLAGWFVQVAELSTMVLLALTRWM